MRMGLELKQRLEQRLTPQLILTMKLLNLSSLELDQVVRKELEENPVLELADASPTEAGTTEAPLPSEELPPKAATAEPLAEPSDKGGVETFKVSAGDEYTIKELLPDDGYIPAHGAAPESDDEGTGLELVAGPGEGLVETLTPHLRALLNPEDAAVAEFIAASLDDNGFLTMSADEIAESQGADPARVREILHMIQRMDPGGLACRDQRESVLVQLELAGYGPDTLEYRLVADHWELLMKKQTSKIARLCGVTEDNVRSAIGRIVSFDLRPARRFVKTDPGYVVPDFSVEWQGDVLVGVPNDETFPRLRLSQRYIDVLNHPKSYSDEQVRFARDKFQRAIGFLRGIESRRRTMKRLVDLIIDEQHAFFLHGPGYLRPATLRQAADILGVHPSTVSRTTAGKYLETTYGIFSFDYFFKAGASDKSRTSIKEQMKGIIGAEDKSCPLSDDEICGKLKDSGVKVSRRTVAKYRVELGIPGCNDRKEF